MLECKRRWILRDWKPVSLTAPLAIEVEESSVTYQEFMSAAVLFGSLMISAKTEGQPDSRQIAEKLRCRPDFDMRAQCFNGRYTEDIVEQALQIAESSLGLPITKLRPDDLLSELQTDDTGLELWYATVFRLSKATGDSTSTVEKRLDELNPESVIALSHYIDVVARVLSWHSHQGLKVAK